MIVAIYFLIPIPCLPQISFLCVSFSILFILPSSFSSFIIYACFSLGRIDHIHAAAIFELLPPKPHSGKQPAVPLSIVARMDAW